MKKVLALALAAVMVLALCGAAFAAAGDLDHDTSVSVTGLESGDTVKLYQVLKWTDGKGWDLTENFATLNVAKINSIVDGTATPPVTLTTEDVEAITAFVKNNDLSHTYRDNANASGVFSCDVALGMYLALVTPVKADTLYNPMIVSADYTTTNSSNTIASSAKLGTIAKKDTVTVTKEATEYTHDTDDIVTFTITAKIPVFADSYVNPKYEITDHLSAGLEIYNAAEDDFVISCTDSTITWSTEPATGAHTFTLTATPSTLLGRTTVATVTITYKAKVTTDAPKQVNEETNDVTVEFSHNPEDDSDYGRVYDETHHFTFDIDGSLFGNGSKKTSEVVKVGVDDNGAVILSSVELDNETWHYALQGAVFGLYTNEGCTTPYVNRNYPDGCTNIVSDERGLLTIKGLDEGEYWLKEISAPAGYIKDSAAHHVVIRANVVQSPELTHTFGDGKTATYTTDVLESYSITIDNKTSSYTMTLSGPNISSVTPADSTDEIANHKGLELPSTGGIGTTIFYVAGLLMVLGAATILISRRRADAE